MIKVIFFVSQSGDLLGFNITGHSELEDFGQDILCAAVSSASYLTANTITDVIGANARVYVDEFGLMDLKIDANESYRCREILSGFKIHVLNLEEQYPKNINVNYTEV